MNSLLALAPVMLALYVPFCASVPDPVIAPTVELTGLWDAPADLAARNLYDGPWGRTRAPDPFAVYTLVEHKHTGVNPGMTVIDERGREWSVKQAPPNGQPAEGPIEVVLSRVLSAIGYHQPPVYYLPSFTYRDDWGTQIEPGGRFRLKDPSLKERGEWSWQRNPFVGTRPYQGLLVTLLLFNSSDLKNANNTLYAHRIGDLAEPWYVVRDLGTALGQTGRWAPRRGDAARYASDPFLIDVHDGLVDFGYNGWHQELVRRRISVNDLRWAGELLGGLSDRQWRDAFLAAGYTPGAAEPFIVTIKERIARAMFVSASAVETTSSAR
jgi:hypothetical protein